MPPFVIHVVISLQPGGLERLVVEWTNARNRKYPDSTLIACLDETGLLADQVEGEAVFCVGANRKRWPWDHAAVCRLAAGIRRHTMNGRLVAIHAHNLAAWQYAVLAVRGTGVGVVYTQHGSNPHNQRPINRIRRYWCRRHTRAIVAVSDTTAAFMCKHQGFSRDRIVVIPNGIAADVAAYNASEKDDIRRQSGLPERAFVVGSVGRFASEKQYVLLVEAFASFHHRCPDSMLLLVGDGPERLAIESAIKAAGIASACRLPGMQALTRPWLKIMDTFCLTSSTEGTSVALLEAGANGLPCIATAVGGNAQVIADGTTGILVPPGDKAAIVNAMDRLYHDRDIRRRMGVAAQVRVMQKYSVDVTMRDYERIYGLGVSRTLPAAKSPDPQV